MDLRKTLAAFFLFSILTGCSTVGTGHRTVVRATCEVDSSRVAAGHDAEDLRNMLCGFIEGRYPHLIAPRGAQAEDLILRVNAKGQPESSARMAAPGTNPSYAEFLEFLRLKYGRSDFRSAELSFNAHDRSIAPAFVRTDVRTALISSLADFFTSDTALSFEEKAKLHDFVEARFHNVPDLAPATALHHIVTCKDSCCGTTPAECVEKCGECSASGRVYYYYPRVSMDFSSSFFSPSVPDRLSYLALVVRLKSPVGRDLPVRFLEFYPKDADLVEFSHGELTQGLQIQAAATAGATDQNVVTKGAEPLVKAATTGSTLGTNIGLTASESLASKLVESIEKRSTGILEEGRTFFSDFRSIRQVRVAGTYNFDLMLEVASIPEVKKGNVISKPVVDRVVADVYLVGVVRHVYRRGRIGLTKRVPESENDHVYEQVLLKVLPDQVLWTAPVRWARPLDTVVPKCEVKVFTNREDARFVVVDAKERVLANGKGQEAVLSFARPALPTTEGAGVGSGGQDCGKLLVKFFPVVVTPEEKGSVVVLEAGEVEGSLKIGEPLTVQGIYRPRI